MANALFVDALKGYEYYLSQRVNVSLNQINEYLLHNGRSPIAHRTYSHFQKLLRNGFRSYIPINKFDVFESLGKVQIAADRRRYQREPLILDAELSRDGKKWHKAKIIDRSIVGLGILLEPRFSTSTAVSGWVRIWGYHDIPVVIVWRKHDEGGTRLGVRGMEFIAKFRIEGEERKKKLRPSTLLTVKREVGDTLDWEIIYGILTKIDAMMRSAADLIYSLEDLYNVEVFLLRPSLKAIKFGSPGETSVKIDFGIADILRILIEKVQFWGLQKRKLRAEVEGQELNNETIALANRTTRIELLRNVLKLSKEVQDPKLTEELILEIREILPRVLGDENLNKVSFIEGSPEHAILTERLIPATLDLTAGDDADYLVSIGDE